MGKKPKTKGGVARKAKAVDGAVEAKTSACRAKGHQKAQKVKAGYLDDLGGELAKLGLMVKPVTADGNCFFRACSDQIQGNEGLHANLRHQVVKFIGNHPEDFAPYMEDGEAFDTYCSRMAKEGVWAGQHEQVAFARLRGVELRIYQAGQPCWTIHPDFPEIPKVAPAMHLSYHDGEHYNSVRLADDSGDGVPASIPLQDGKVVTSSEFRATTSRQEEEKMQRVAMSTGCEDKAQVMKALEQAGGSVDQAVETLISELAEAAERAESSNPRPSDGTNGNAHSTSDSHSAVPQESSQEPTIGAQLQPEVSSIGDAVSSTALEQSCPADEFPSQKGELQAELKQKKVSEAKANKQRDPPRNRPCPCGSGKKFKDCCSRSKSSADRSPKGKANGLTTDLSGQLGSLYI